MSSEHDISVLSAKSIINNIDKEKYEIFPIYIDEKGNWYESREQSIIENIIKYLKNMDVIFPVMHGKYGEDGSIQGMLDMFNIPYVGCKGLASSIAMNKAYSKIIFEKIRN